MVNVGNIQKLKDDMVFDIKNKMTELDIDGIEYQSYLGIFIDRNTLSNLDFFTLKNVWDWFKNHA
jgi:hypothetical protein